MNASTTTTVVYNTCCKQVVKFAWRKACKNKMLGVVKSVTPWARMGGLLMLGMFLLT